MNTSSEVFEIIKKSTPEDIIKDNKLGAVSGCIVERESVFEVQLRSGCVYVSLMTNKKSFSLLKEKDVSVIVESSGWWSSLADSNVAVLTERGEVLKAIRLL